MNFKVGDKVKFLNESGGGEIKKIISSNLVSVYSATISASAAGSDRNF
jgi:hypothetical protein